MTTLSPQADRMIRAAAHNLIHLAALHGVLPTLETQPRQPLAMGNHSLRLTLRPVRHPDPAAADKCRAPHVLEKLSYHDGARWDMSLEDCLSFLADGWKDTPGRGYTQLVLQLTELLAAAPAQPYCYSDCQAYTKGIEGELQALRKQLATYQAREALGLLPTATAQPAPASASEKYDDTLAPFLALMRRELHANSSKGDRPGWLSMRPDQCLLEIYWHVAKLSAAVKNGDQALIAEHAADVANMAMMQADIAGLLAAAPQPAAPAGAADTRIAEVEQAIRNYHFALDCREHGGVAQDHAFKAICNAMGMHWTQGEEVARRAATGTTP